MWNTKFIQILLLFDEFFPFWDFKSKFWLHFDEIVGNILLYAFNHYHEPSFDGLMCVLDLLHGWI